MEGGEGRYWLDDLLFIAACPVFLGVLREGGFMNMLIFLDIIAANMDIMVIKRL